MLLNAPHFNIIASHLPNNSIYSVIYQYGMALLPYSNESAMNWPRCCQVVCVRVMDLLMCWSGKRMTASLADQVDSDCFLLITDRLLCPQVQIVWPYGNAVPCTVNGAPTGCGQQEGPFLRNPVCKCLQGHLLFTPCATIKGNRSETFYF